MTKSKSNTRPFVFVLMPFSSTFEDIYKFGIKKVCEDIGARCERVDEQIFHENILNRIYEQIEKANIIVAEMTGRNPNVFYEVGYVKALNKPIILLTQDAKDIPFDLTQYPHINYGGKISTLESQLKSRIRHYVKEGFENSQLTLEGDWIYEATCYDRSYGMSGECQIEQHGNMLAIKGWRLHVIKMKEGIIEDKPLRWESTWACICDDKKIRVQYRDYGQEGVEGFLVISLPKAIDEPMFGFFHQFQSATMNGNFFLRKKKSEKLVN